MAAPTTSILDNFNRANGAPGANIVQACNSYSVPNIVSNRLDWPQYPSFCWNSSFNADQEAFCRLPPTPGTEFRFLLRWNNLAGGAESGYQIFVDISATGSTGLYKWTAGQGTESIVFFNNGDMLTTDEYVWVTALGNVFSIYGSSDGITYTLRRTYTDSSINAAGYIGGFEPNNTTAAWIDDFGGGSVVSVDNCLPDADVTTTGWTPTPLWSKVNDASDATVIQATAS